jgi:hypothetical protein
MNGKVWFAVAAIALGIALPQTARSATYISTLTQPNSFNATAVGSDGWLAVSFITGAAPDGYNLDSVQLRGSSGPSPNGNFSVSLYSDDSGAPGLGLGPLAGPNPSADAIYTFTSAGLVLAPSTQYWITARATQPQSVNGYVWDLPTGTNYTSADGWTIDVNDAYAYSPTGGQGDWAAQGGALYYFAVNATAVPEPGTCAAGVLAIGAIIWLRRRRSADT